MKSAAWIAAAAGLCVTLNVQAETLYVIEQLIVNVSSEPDGGERVASIRSGDKVESIERQGDQTHVRLASGSEGWVKSSYLSNDPPLRQRLDERTQELEKSKRRVEQLESELAQAKLVANARPAPVEAPPPPPPAAEPTPEPQPSSQSITATKTFFPEASGRPTWKWVVGSSAVCLLAGFALGWRALDRRIRRKYGGLRIY
jgi:hypothetical protein